MVALAVTYLVERFRVVENPPDEQVSTFDTSVEAEDAIPLDNVQSSQVAVQEHGQVDDLGLAPSSKKPRQRFTPPPSDRVLRSHVPRSQSLPASFKLTSPSPPTTRTTSTKKRARSAPQQYKPQTGQAAGSALSKRPSNKKAKA